MALAANGRGIGRQWPRHWPPFVVKLGLFVFVLAPVIRKMSAETRPVIYELFDPRDGGLPRPLQTKKEPVCLGLWVPDLLPLGFLPLGLLHLGLLPLGLLPLGLLPLGLLPLGLLPLDLLPLGLPPPSGRGSLGRESLGRGSLSRESLGRGSPGRESLGRGSPGRESLSRGSLSRGSSGYLLLRRQWSADVSPVLCRCGKPGMISCTSPLRKNRGDLLYFAAAEDQG